MATLTRRSEKRDTFMEADCGLDLDDIIIDQLRHTTLSGLNGACFRPTGWINRLRRAVTECIAIRGVAGYSQLLLTATVLTNVT